MNDEQEIEFARAELLKEAKAYITENFGPIEQVVDWNQTQYVPPGNTAEPKPERREVASIKLEHEARMLIGDTEYTLRFGYDRGYFSHWLHWAPTA